MEHDNDGEDDLPGLDDFFLCEDYIIKSFQIGDIDQCIYCSNMSMTDHDLTGQIVWPASIQLAWFIFHLRSKFEGRVVIELGAGCGLGGFFSTNYSDTVIITDGNDIVCRLLKKTADYLRDDTDKSIPAERVHIHTLLWGLKQSVADLVERYSLEPDIIIGADVILWPLQVRPLLQTVRWLLSFKSTSSSCFISYIVRAHSTTHILFQLAEEMGLQVDVIDPASFLPIPQPISLENLEKMMLHIRIKDPVDVSFVSEPSESEDSREAMRTLSSPC